MRASSTWILHQRDLPRLKYVGLLATWLRRSMSVHQLKLVISLLLGSCFQMIGCACPFHDAVYQVLRGRVLDQVDEATRREIAKRVIRAVERIDWTESPWRALPKARDLCQQLLSVDPEERGGDAVQVMMASPWLNPRVRKRLRQLVRKKTSEASGSRSIRGR